MEARVLKTKAPAPTTVAPPRKNETTANIPVEISVVITLGVFTLTFFVTRIFCHAQVSTCAVVASVVASILGAICYFAIRLAFETEVIGHERQAKELQNKSEDIRRELLVEIRYNIFIIICLGLIWLYAVRSGPMASAYWNRDGASFFGAGTGDWVADLIMGAFIGLFSIQFFFEDHQWMILLNFVSISLFAYAFLRNADKVFWSNATKSLGQIVTIATWLSCGFVNAYVLDHGVFDKLISTATVGILSFAIFAPLSAVVLVIIAAYMGLMSVIKTMLRLITGE